METRQHNVEKGDDEERKEEEQKKEGEELSALLRRARESKWPAVSMQQAYTCIESLLPLFEPCLKYEPVPALQPGQIVAERVTAPADAPDCRKSIKDGYAVLFSDGAGDRNVVGSSTAGAPFTGKMLSGECVRVSTGAVVPDDADAVVQVEDTEIVKHDSREELVIKIKKAPVNVGQDIRKPGDDMLKGDVLLERGCVLSAGEIGLLNELGQKAVAVFRRPKVCILSTGNELVDSMSEHVPTGCIRDSNRPQLMALFHSLGFKPIDAGIAPDKRSELVAAIRNALSYANVLVTSGGVSMGEHDLLKDVLQTEMGFKIEFGRVWMKPGMPATLASGRVEDEMKCVFALPGNPVSSWVCAHLFAAPLLRHLAGYKNIYNPRIYVKLASGVKLGERPEYKRVWLQLPEMTATEFWKKKEEAGAEQAEAWLPVAHVTGGQLSSRLASTVQANALLELPEKSSQFVQLEAGSLVPALLLSRL